MNLKRLFMLLFILNTVSFIFVAVVINKYQKATNELENAYQMQYKSLILAQELRQSSDDLTRMARTYVITGNQMFEEQFKIVLDIRNGQKSRPQRYNGIFWDFFTLGDKEPEFEGEKVALRELMRRANFTEDEINLLFKSQKESDDLTNLEHKAMSAVKGIFQDKNGEYTLKGKPDFKLAREIMHGDEYHKAKIRIMKPLDDFYKAFESRTKQKVDEAKIVLQNQEFNVNVIVVFSIFLFLMSFFIILFRIVYPIDLLRVSMMKLSSNDMSVEVEKNKYQDEVGDMIGAVQIFKDNTEKLIESEQQIKQAMQEATHANKAKSIFLARMSHELRTPLNAILGFANLLNKSENISKKEKENLDVIKRSGKHLLNIINEILELSKIEAGKIEIIPKTFQLHELIKDIDSMFAFRCTSKGLTFILNVDSKIPNIIKADEQRLRQILINLLGNALKFTKEGKITLNIYEKNKRVFFEVKDTGIGIEKEDQKKIFKPFEQIKKDDYKSHGTGLGLSITKELISLMGGSIYVKSFVGVGSEFYFSIDYENSDESLLEEQMFSKDIIGIEKINDNIILVVDDIKENRELVIQILDQYGFKTCSANSGKEAIQIVKLQDIDLIFMDTLMPGLDGLETTKIIKTELQKQIPIVTLSANVFEDDRQKAFKYGADDFLSKPINEKELIKILQKYLDIQVKFEEQKENSEDTLKLENLSKQFLEKLREFSLQMDNNSIENLLDSEVIDEYTKNHIKQLIEDFDYPELIRICKQNLK